MRRLAACQLLPDGETIDSHLEPTLFQRLSKRSVFGSEIEDYITFYRLDFHSTSHAQTATIDASRA